MNLIQQFPDISEKIRARLRTSQNYKAVNAIQPLSYIEDKAVTQYYEGEFRRWHLKLFFIIAASFGILYFMLLQSSWILNRIADSRGSNFDF